MIERGVDSPRDGRRGMGDGGKAGDGASREEIKEEGKDGFSQIPPLGFQRLRYH